MCLVGRGEKNKFKNGGTHATISSLYLSSLLIFNQAPLMSTLFLIFSTPTYFHLTYFSLLYQPNKE